MIDSLEMMREKTAQQNVPADFGLDKGKYGVITFHRPANVDDPDILATLCQSLIAISKEIPLVFQVYPRTRKNLANFKLLSKLERTDTITLTEPLIYVRFRNLVFNCRIAIEAISKPIKLWSIYRMPQYVVYTVC